MTSSPSVSRTACWASVTLQAPVEVDRPYSPTQIGLASPWAAITEMISSSPHSASLDLRPLESRQHAAGRLVPGYAWTEATSNVPLAPAAYIASRKGASLA